MQNRDLGTDGKVISFLRFPLVIMILFAHSNFVGINEAWSSLKYTPQIIGYAGLIFTHVSSIFFFISGYLFFHEGVFTPSIYSRKLKTRARTLLVPYLLWNIIFIAALAVFEAFTGKTPIIDKPVADMNVTDFLSMFWDMSLIGDGQAPKAPIDMPLWFISDLMIIDVISPIIYVFVKLYSKLHIYVQTCLLLPIAYIFSKTSLCPAFVTNSLFYFTLGAYFTINRMSVSNTFRRMDAAFLMTIVVAFYYDYQVVAYSLLILLAFSWLGKRYEAKKLWSFGWVARSGFFLFAYHMLMQGVIYYALKLGYVPVSGELSALVAYLLSPAVMAVVGIGLYYVMERFCPRLTALLTGGRC